MEPERPSRFGRRHVPIAAALATIFALPATAFAGESVAPEQVLITARPPDPVGNNAYSTTLLDEQQLRISPELDTALRQVPGLSLFRRNSSLSTNQTGQAVSLRSIGASGAGRALVTLDGVPQNDPFGQWVIWSSLPPEDLQAAEIVRGAGAGPYGAGALTGVIALTERTGTGAVIDAEGGEIGQARIAGAGNVQFDNVSIGASAMYLTSGGWIPVNDAQRGRADIPLWEKATSASIHGGVEVVPGTQVNGRFGFYDERRGNGTVGATTRAKGTTGSITLVHPDQPDELGWRLQGWFRDTDVNNQTVGLTAGRVSTTPSGNQYAVPALGWGTNAAVRGAFSWLDWELGADARLADGESRELFAFSAGQFRSGRLTGGRTFVGGLYAEGASRIDDWTITGGVRVDEWRNYSGHTIERTLATGAITLNDHPADADGTVPTARAGLRHALGDGLFLRSAAYAGFRPPSLSELFRAFRQGNNFTLANSALKPERLYGVEAGVGDDDGAFTWDVTGFWNKISDAVTLVTLASGPGTFPGAGFIPAGGQLIQRQNVGDIGAYGMEGDAQWAIDSSLALRAGFNVTDAHVHGGTLAPQLTGKRPAQTPRWTITGGIVATPDPFVTLEAYLRYESLRWSDDLNALPLPAVATVDTRISFHVLPTMDVYAAIDNLFDAEVTTMRGADGVANIEAPRMFRLGIRLAY
jgi:outer membrane receptor protein involved in Fe transport